jgi:NMD protein affecting ribosome stability and mRNA decay
MKTTVPTAGFHPIRRDQLRPERVHDTYKLRGKLAEPAVCPDCGAVYHGGRWQWTARPAGAHETACPACQRTKDRFPAGFVEVGGPYFAAHRDELLRLLRHREEKEKGEHPLARIIAVEDAAEGVLVTTTDIHLARDLGEALHHAHQGELEFHYNQGENLLRVHWRR